MIPLETNQLILTWFYAFSSDEADTKLRKILRLIFSLNVTVTHFLTMAAGGLFISKFISTNLEEAIFALFHTIAFFNMLYQCICIIILRREFTEMMKSLAKIYNESENKILIIYCCQYKNVKLLIQFIS